MANNLNMAIVREGIATTPPEGFSLDEDSGQSIWGSIGSWLGDTVGTYATNARDEFFAREGISNGSASDRVEQDRNAQGDLAGKASVVEPFYKNPFVIGGAVAAVSLVAFLIFRK